MAAKQREAGIRRRWSAERGGMAQEVVGVCRISLTRIKERVGVFSLGRPPLRRSPRPRCSCPLCVLALLCIFVILSVSLLSSVILSPVFHSSLFFINFVFFSLSLFPSFNLCSSLLFSSSRASLRFLLSSCLLLFRLSALPLIPSCSSPFSVLPPIRLSLPLHPPFLCFLPSQSSVQSSFFPISFPLPLSIFVARAPHPSLPHPAAAWCLETPSNTALYRISVSVFSCIWIFFPRSTGFE